MTSNTGPLHSPLDKITRITPITGVFAIEWPLACRRPDLPDLHLRLDRSAEGSGLAKTRIDVGQPLTAASGGVLTKRFFPHSSSAALRGNARSLVPATLVTARLPHALGPVTSRCSSRCGSGTWNFGQ
jgi:hypothetical protein